MNKQNTQLVENLIKRITKSVILERLSTRVWHFLPLTSMWSIVDNGDMMHLSRSERESDIGIFKSYDKETGTIATSAINDPRKGMSHNGKEIAPYYLSLSRSPSNANGYARMRNEGGSANSEWKKYLCRIEFDGDLLNQYFKGKPVNYFRDKYEKSNKIMNLPDKDTGKESFTVYSITPGSRTLQPKQIHGVSQHYDEPDINRKNPNRKFDTGARSPFPIGSTDYNQIRRNQMSEFEDRLFSYEPDINIKKFVKRIDIYIGIKVNLIKESTLQMIAQIMREFPNITHIYNNEAAFNLAPTNVGGKGEYNEITQVLIPILNNFKDNYVQKITDRQLDIVMESLIPIRIILCALEKYGVGKKMDTNKFLRKLLTDIGMNEFLTQEDLNNSISIFESLLSRYMDNPKYQRFFSKTNNKNLESGLKGKLKYVQTNIYEEYLKISRLANNIFNNYSMSNGEKIKFRKSKNLTSNDPTKAIYTTLTIALNVLKSK